MEFSANYVTILRWRSLVWVADNVYKYHYQLWLWLSASYWNDVHRTDLWRSSWKTLFIQQYTGLDTISNVHLLPPLLFLQQVLGSYCMGGTAAVGTTYNYCGKLNNRMLAAYERGDMKTAQLEQVNV